ncbi:hypothetical protein P1J78_18980 [Psychromarinibacter sp. C21-152]|uniref:Uncharacterized protein n=1 Tax=Psychromarinibacter sediminicola TaxID=3033385 RepID=A0AAE3TBN2_9RHOB|nr:hypothetical protein [Psychromarinibacter sediminicola]MDF0602830.1 hypothetical protein [Psychromarinibacter sediminicola]
MSLRARLFWAVFAVTLAVYLAMVFWTMPRITEAAGGLRPFDMRPGGYGPEAARAFLSALGEDGRAVYLGPQAWLDLAYPVLMAATMILAFRLVLPRRAGWAQALLVLPVIAAGLDLWENALVRGLLTAPGMPDDAAIGAASRVTVAKSVAYSAEFLVLLGALGVRAWRRQSRRRG